MDEINFKIPKQHVPEVTNLLRNHLNEVRNTEARDWIQLGATKTGVVYRLKGNPPHAHE